MLKIRNMYVSVFIIMLLVFGAISASAAAGGPALSREIRTQNGLVRGISSEYDEAVTLFKGIPFAAPPVGENRWRAPQPAENWHGVLMADTYAPMCPQILDTNDSWGPEFYYDYLDEYPNMSEDCLYLNVATTSANNTVTGDRKPVMLWFHGGASYHGYSYEPEFAPEELAKKGVVVVSAAYRLGLFGYYADDRLDAESPYGTSGNYGFLDQIAAMEWVRDNIAAFGGDPDNVTIFGQSAGAGAIRLHLISPLSRGLFHRAIMQSSFNALGTIPTLETMKERSAAYMEIKSMGNASLETLRELPFTYFVNEHTTKAEYYRNLAQNLDGRVLTEQPPDFFRKPGALDGIDILYGSTDGEQSPWRGVFPESIESVRASLRNIYGGLYDKWAFETLFPLDTLESATGTSTEANAETGLMRHRVIGEILADNGYNPYVYYFAHWPGNSAQPGRDPSVDRAWHSADLWYVFNSMRDIPQQRAWTETDRRMGDIVSSYWANFAATGNPNGAGLPEWPAFDLEDRMFLRIGNGLTGDIEARNLLHPGHWANRDRALREHIILSHGLQGENPAKDFIAETKYGLAQGVFSEGDTSVTIFRGIPYAAPPVGALRWKAPEDPEPWEGVRVFHTYANAAMQYPDGMQAEPWATDFYYLELPDFSEDCLYLNVATSAVTGDEKMPVYIWFHGGGLRHGYSYEVVFNNEVMARKGVVVVTVGQRLGVFGNLALPQLTEESGYGGSGNYGLMDEIKALDWVYENIAAFGGDPGNITIGGQSGGTTKSGGLLASPLSAGKIRNVILQSGLRLQTFPSMENAEAAGVAYLRAIGLTGEESLEELRAMDAAILMGPDYDTNQNNVPNTYYLDNRTIFEPSLINMILDGRLDGINILHGANLGEAAFRRSANKEEFFANYKDMLGDLYDQHDFEALIGEYVTQLTEDNTSDVARALAGYGLTTQDSRSLGLGMLLGGRLDISGINGNVYTYLFTRFLPGRNVENDWAWHSGEMWYTFASLRDIPQHRDWEAVDYELADIMSSYWTNFMKTGDPNGEGLPEWKPSTAGAPFYMDLGDEVNGHLAVTAFDELLLDLASRQFGIER